MSNSRFKNTKLAKGFKTSEDAEKNGVWRLHPDFGIWAKVRRATLPEHRRALRKHAKPFAHLTVMDPKDELRVKQKAAAEVLVADWGQTEQDADGANVLDGAGQPVRVPLTDEAGNEIRASHDNVLEAFFEMPDFYRWVADEADTFENYRASVVESAGGNLLDSLRGSESGEAPPPAPSSNDALSVETQSPLVPS